MKQMIIFDFSLLRGRIRELYKSEKKFAEKMRKTGISMSTGAFNNKINGRSVFSEIEIFVMCELLQIPLEDIHKYFFVQKYELNS